MQVHIAQRGGHILHRSEALAVAGALLQLLDQLQGDRLARLVVLGIDVEHLRLEGPMLVDLRRQLDKVTLDTRSTVVAHVTHKAVEGVAELVEEGLHIVDALQGVTLGIGGGHIAAVHHDGDHTLLALVTLPTEARAPGTGTLRGTGEGIAVEDGQAGAILVHHLVGLGRRLVGGNLRGDLVEGQPIELAGHVEDALHHVANLEVGTHLLLIDREFALLGLVEVVHIVPTRRLEVATLATNLLANVVQLLLGLLHGGGPHLHQQVVNRFGGLGHTLLEGHLGVVLEAHQAGLLQAQADNLGRDGLVVVVVVLVATVVVGLIDLFTQRTIRAVLQHGVAARTLHIEHPLARLTLLLGHLGGSGDVGLGQTCQLGLLLDHHEGVVGLVQQVLREVKLQHCKAAVQLTQASLLFVVEVGTAIDKAVVDVFQHFLLLCAQLLGSLILIDLLDTLEEGLVEVDVVAVGREEGRQLLLQGTGLVGRVARREGAEGATGTAQQAATLVEGGNGVGEGRLVGRGDDGLNLGLLLGHTLQHRLPVILDGNLGKGGDAEGGIELLQQRIFALVCTPCGGKCYGG